MRCYSIPNYCCLTPWFLIGLFWELDVDEGLVSEGEAFYPCVGNKIVVLQSDDPSVRENEHRFKGDDHSWLKLLVKAWGENGVFVDLQPQSMTYKPHLSLSLAIEVFSIGSLLNLLDDEAIKIRPSDARLDLFDEERMDFKREIVCPYQIIRQMADDEGPELIRNIAVDSNAIVDSDGFVGSNFPNACSLCHGRRISFSTMGAIKEGDSRSALSSKDEGNGHLLVPSTHPHYTHMAFPAGDPCEIAIHFELGHSFTDDLSDFHVSFMEDCGGSPNMLDFIMRLNHPKL